MCPSKGGYPMIDVKKYRVNWLGLLGVAIFLAVWSVLANWMGPMRLPSPLAVVEQFFTSIRFSKELVVQGGGQKGLRPHLMYTFTRTLLGGSVGVILGILAGLAMGWSRRLRYFLEPPIELIRTIPPLAAAPFFLMWFGPTPVGHFSMLVFYTFLILVINTLEAIRNVPAVYHQYAATQGASRNQIFRTVVVPAIMPELTGAIRVAIGLSWGIQIVVELLGAPRGMGQVFSMLLSVQRLSLIMAGIIWLTVIAVAVDFVFTRFAHYVTRWQPIDS